MTKINGILFLVLIFKIVYSIPIHNDHTSDDQISENKSYTDQEPEEEIVSDYDQDTENTDVSEEPSEIVEKFALPEGIVPDQSNVPLRPKRRRRRRRRKQSKPITTNPKELESYYLILEEDENGEPISYTLTDDLQGINNQKTKLPRGKIKRRRPIIPRQEPFSVNINLKNQDSIIDSYIRGHHFNNTSKLGSFENKNQSKKETTLIKFEAVNHTNINNGIEMGEKVIQSTGSTNSKNIEYKTINENLIRKETEKIENAGTETVSSGSKLNQENQINRNESWKLIFDSTRNNDFNKTINSKYRRLPSPETFFQGREQLLKNDTQLKIENNSNDLKISIVELPKEIKNTTNLSTNNFKLSDFEESTGIKTSHSPFLPTIRTLTEIPNTFDNTAFIYISCNHSLHEILKHKFNFTGKNITLSADKYLDLFQNHHENLPERITEKYNMANHTQREREKKMIENPTNPANTVQHKSNLELINNKNFKFFEIDNQFQDQKLNADSKSHLFTNFHQFQQEKEINRKTTDQSRSKTKLEEISASSSSSTLFPDFFADNIEVREELLKENELSSYLRNNTIHRTLGYRNRNIDRKKLSVEVKTGIIISGGILALAVLSFFALLLTCKIRQEKLKMKCQSELYEESLRNSDFRQSFKSSSPVAKRTEFRQSYRNTNPVLQQSEFRQSFRNISPVVKQSEFRQSFRSTSPIMKQSEFRQSVRSTSPVIKQSEFRQSIRSNNPVMKQSEFRQSVRSTSPVIKANEFRQSFKSTTPVVKSEFVGRSFRDSVRSNLRPNMNYW